MTLNELIHGKMLENCTLYLINLGVAHLIKADMVKEGAAVIDVGESVFYSLPPYMWQCVSLTVAHSKA